MKKESVVPKRYQGISEACVGVFSTLEEARAALDRIRELGVQEQHISLFTPSALDQLRTKVPTTDTEQGGMGAALGGSILGALGLGMGVILFVPGVGAVSVLGALAAALLGAGSAATGALVGSMLERTSLEGLVPADEVFVYEDALAQGRSVLVVSPPTDLLESVQTVLQAAGAESIDAAREDWWVGIRDSHRLRYAAPQVRELWDDPLCRAGFELGRWHQRKGLSEEEGESAARAEQPEGQDSKAFWLGYHAGRSPESGSSGGDR
jgi:hypothetical protein